MNNELLNFYIDFFNTINDKDIKTNKQVINLLTKYTFMYDEGGLTPENIPDELEDMFYELLLAINAADSEGDIGYIIYRDAQYLTDEKLDNNKLYWTQPEKFAAQSDIEVCEIDFEDDLTFDEIKKIFNLSDKDIEDIQKGLDFSLTN